MADKVKFVFAALFLASGIAAFYFLSDQAMILRALSVGAGLGVALAVAAQTGLGKTFIGFAGESVAETKKVVWPTRKETLQFTGIVFVFVVVLALILWGVDKGVEWMLYDLILGWRKS